MSDHNISMMFSLGECIFFGVLCVAGILSNLLILCSLMLTLQGRDEGGGNRSENLYVKLTVGSVVMTNALLCFFSMITFYLIVSTSDIYIVYEGSNKILNFFTCESLYCSIWFLALLCLLYCLKILSCHQGFFLKLKQNTPSVVICGLITGLILGSAFSALAFRSYKSTSGINLNNSDSTSVQINPYDNSFNWIFIALFGFLWFSFPLTVTVISCVTIFNFLIRHMQRMKGQSSDIQKRTVWMLFVQVLSYSILLITVFAEIAFCQISKQFMHPEFALVYPLYCLATSINFIFNKELLRRRLALLIRIIRCGSSA